MPDSLQGSVLQGVWQCGRNAKRSPVKVGEKALVSIETPAWLPHKNRIMACCAAGQLGRSYSSIAVLLGSDSAILGLSWGLCFGFELFHVHLLKSAVSLTIF